MANARTTSLHERLSTELRRAVERDLIEQPPGRETYQKVWEYHGLAEKGVAYRCLARYGGYLRALHRNQWIREFGNTLVGEDVEPRIAGMIKSRLLETLTTAEDPTAGELFKASLALKSLKDAAINEEVERRSRDKHEAWKRDQAARQERELQKVGAARGLTPDVLAEIKAKVLGV